MLIIEFESLEKTSYTKFKIMEFKNKIGDKEYIEHEKTAIPESIRTEYKKYYIPIDKINSLTSFDGKYCINDIQVNEENFKKVLEILKNEV